MNIAILNAVLQMLRKTLKLSEHYWEFKLKNVNKKIVIKTRPFKPFLTVKLFFSWDIKWHYDTLYASS